MYIHPIKCFLAEIHDIATTLLSGADPGRSLGSQDPPPEIYQRSQKNDVLV